MHLSHLLDITVNCQRNGFAILRFKNLRIGQGQLIAEQIGIHDILAVAAGKIIVKTVFQTAAAETVVIGSADQIGSQGPVRIDPAI